MQPASFGCRSKSAATTMGPLAAGSFWLRHRRVGWSPATLTMRQLRFHRFTVPHHAIHGPHRSPDRIYRRTGDTTATATTLHRPPLTILSSSRPRTRRRRPGRWDRFATHSRQTLRAHFFARPALPVSRDNGGATAPALTAYEITIAITRVRKRSDHRLHPDRVTVYATNVISSRR